MLLALEASSAQIQRIVQSKAFRTSEVHRNLLTYLGEKSLSGESDNIKEYTVGLDVFGKPDSYDPRQESTVRMHVARLRQKLADYYRTEGVDDPIFVDLPKGGFRVTFEPRAVAAVPDPETPVAAPKDRTGRYWLEVVLVAALLVTVGTALYFANQLWSLQTPETVSVEMTPELRQLWEPLINSARPLIVAVSTAKPETSGAGPASGLFRLGEFLGKLKASVQVLESNQIEAPEVAMGNVVYLGRMDGDNRQMQAMVEGRPFVLDAQGIHNTQPLSGEPALFADRLPADPSDTEESFALISRVPGLYGNGEVLYLSGNRVGAITGGVQAFTDPKFAATLVSEMKDATGKLPQYYQVVLKVRAMDGMPIETHFVLHRALVREAKAK